MFSRNMQAIYKRWLILGMLLMCLFVFGYTDVMENVSTATAALCTQDCRDSNARCNDACATSCSADSTDDECADCLTPCEDQYLTCMSRATSCNKAARYTPQCQVHYGDHCPVINGTANCNDPSAHSGYYQICSNLGGGQCVACPDHHFCTGSNGAPPCF